jgi:hypothetical protein
VARRLNVLAGYGTVRSVRVPEVQEDLWIATRRGLRVLAAGDQVPLGRYERSGAVSAPPDMEGRPCEVNLPRAFAHELGVNRTFVRLAELARRDGGRLTVWRNEAESTHLFRDHGERWWIRPDGSGLIDAGVSSMPFLLEYDRGTLSRAQLRTKLRAYERYYHVDAWEEVFDRPPALLFVCADEPGGRGDAVIAAAASPVIPALVTRESGLATQRRPDNITVLGEWPR